MRHDHHHAPYSRVSGIVAGIAGLLVTAGGAAAQGQAQAQRPPEVGLWFNHSGKGVVEIRPCGATAPEADHLCGYIVWLREPNGRNGKPLTDGHNPKITMRTRPICGLPVLGSLRPMSDGSWDLGWVYDPEQGKSFDAAIQLRTRDQLILTGYKGIKMFSKSFVWKRAPDDLPRCGQAGLEQDARATASPSLATAKPPLPGRASQARAELGGLTPPRPVPAVKPSSAAR